MDRNILPGFLGAMASMVAVWPTEVIKYHKQLSRETYFTIIRKLWPRGYYTGFAANAISVVPMNALPVVMMEPINRRLSPYIQNRSVVSMTSSLAVTTFSSIATLPLVNISLRKILFPTNSSMKYFAQNPLELCSGGSSYYIKNLTRIGVKMACYDIIRRKVAWTHDWRDSAISGGIATSIAAIVSNPFDVILTRQQTNYGKRMSFSDIMAYGRQNINKLFDGVTIRTLRGIPGGMILFGVMEYTSLILEYKDATRL